ncbi:hypothetical protein [Azospirillum argentinense]
MGRGGSHGGLGAAGDRGCHGLPLAFFFVPVPPPRRVAPTGMNSAVCRSSLSRLFAQTIELIQCQ